MRVETVVVPAVRADRLLLPREILFRDAAAFKEDYLVLCRSLLRVVRLFILALLVPGLRRHRLYRRRGAGFMSVTLAMKVESFGIAPAASLIISVN